MSPSQFFKSMSKMSVADKKVALAKADGNAMEVIRLALDPNLPYNVEGYVFEEPCEHGEGYEYNLNVMYHTLGKISSGEVCGSDALKAVLDCSCQIDSEQQESLRMILDKDLKCGVTLAMVQDVFPDMIKSFCVMDAGNTDMANVKYPILAEPRLNGKRCVAVVSGMVSYMDSHGATLSEFHKFDKEMLQLADGQNMMLDGWVVGIPKKPSDMKSAKLEFHIWDVIVNGIKETQKQRTERLKNMFLSVASDSRETFKVNRVKGVVCADLGAVTSFCDKYAKKGYPEVVLKALGAQYQYRTSPDWTIITSK